MVQGGEEHKAENRSCQPNKNGISFKIHHPTELARSEGVGTKKQKTFLQKPQPELLSFLITVFKNGGCWWKGNKQSKWVI